jgi:hypothetical protein
MLRDVFEARYRELVAAWIQHHQARRRGVPLEQLAASRLHLDRMRDLANTARRAFAPDGRELESVLQTTFCDRLGETVFLFAADAVWADGGPRFTCVCGDPLDGRGEVVPAQR